MSDIALKIGDLLEKPFTGKVITKLTNGRINANIQRLWIHRKYINLIPELPLQGKPRIIYLPTIHEFILTDLISRLGVKLSFARFIILDRLTSVLAERARIIGQPTPNLSNILSQPKQWYGGEFIDRSFQRYWIISCFEHNPEVRIVSRQNLDESIVNSKGVIVIPITDLLSFIDLQLAAA